MSTDIAYRTGTAVETDISIHLKKCDHNFVPPLSEKVNIDAYAKKIAEKSITFEAWNNDVLAGLIAVYFNYETRSAYITNVSTLNEFGGQGIGSKLMDMCIRKTLAERFAEILLEVSEKSDAALSLYKKNGFVPVGMNNNMTMMRKQL